MDNDSTPDPPQAATSIPAQGSPPAQAPADALLSRLAGRSELERSRIVGAHLREAVAEDPLAWIEQLHQLYLQVPLKISTVRSLCADLSWQCRSLGHAYPQGLRSPASSTDLVATYVQAYRLRFDYRFDALAESCAEWMLEFPDDALITAFAAFAALATRAPQGPVLYRTSLAAPDADARSRQACLAGMWLAHHLPEQTAEILDLSNIMMARGEADPNVFYWRAAALRKSRRYDEAVQDIDRAISMLAVGDNLVHQDYVRERELIVSARETHERVSTLGEEIQADLLAWMKQEIDQASTELEKRIAEAQRVVSDGLLKIVEILGLFVALIGFVAGTGATALKAQSVTDRGISMTLVLVGSLVFFILLRLVTSFRRRG